jgi:hypothetical protein
MYDIGRSNSNEIETYGYIIKRSNIEKDSGSGEVGIGGKRNKLDSDLVN